MTPLDIFDTDLTAVTTLDSITREQFDAEIRPAGKPVILRGLVNDWPAVRAGKESHQKMGDYLKRLDNKTPAITFVAPADVKGRYFYNADMTGFNFDRRSIPLTASIDKLLSQVEAPDPLCVYAGASSSTDILPSFGKDNPMPLVDTSVPPLVWIGNAARIAPHFDSSENIACSVAGSRKFLIFPPEQVSNLYVGPIEHNMAGQPASLVDPRAINLETHPKFEEAMTSAFVAELEPGDALYLPALWWHYVESSEPLNVLVNYWWNEVNKGSPMDCLGMSLLMIRDLPPTERAAWRELFDHYIFGEGVTDAANHIPENVRGILGADSPKRDAIIKQYLMSQLPKSLS